jgi:heme-degrading monooxygenase HmoA
MVVEYTRYRIPKDRKASFEEAYRRAQQYLAGSPHCVSYELSHCTEEQERYVLRIEWISAQEHLQGFRHEAGFKNFFSLVQPFLPNIEEMQHYELTGVGGIGGGGRKRTSAA